MIGIVQVGAGVKVVVKEPIIVRNWFVGLAYEKDIASDELRV